MSWDPKNPDDMPRAANITRDRCRQVLTEGIDRVLNHRWLSGLSSEQNAVLMGCRSTIVQDDSIVDKVVANVGPYQNRTAQLTDDLVEGEVQSIGFGPGRKDGLVNVLLKPNNDYGRYVTVFVTGPKCVVKVDGNVTDYLGMIQWVAVHDCRVKIITDSNGIGYSTEFTCIKGQS